MLTARLTRTKLLPKRTISDFLLHDGNRVLLHCHACEPPVRGDGDPATVAEWKIKGDSAIPYGTYPLCLTYSDKYRCYMWQAMYVPGFDGVRVHAGNTEKDTQGCILLGEDIMPDNGGVSRSRIAVAVFEKLMKTNYKGEARIIIERAEDDQ